jgi:hypothetical protein
VPPAPVRSAAEEREALFDADIRAVQKKARDLPKIEVKETLGKLHPLVQDTKVWLEYHFDTRPFLERRHPGCDPINISIFQDSMRRALAFLDALVKAVVRIGGTVALSENRYRQATEVSVCGERVTAIRLRERYRQEERSETERQIWEPRFAKVGTGQLILESGASYDSTIHCQDTGRGQIEDAINAVIVRWVVAAGEGRIQRRREAEERARRQEEERQRRQREAEEQARQQAEQERLDALLSQASNWGRAQRLRAFVQAVEAAAVQLHGVLEPGSELEQWLAWGREQADRLDPLTESSPAVLDEDV